MDWGKYLIGKIITDVKEAGSKEGSVGWCIGQQMNQAFPYREQGRELTPQDMEPPPGCPCRMSVEQRWAFQAIGGWQHTSDCIRWQRITGQTREVSGPPPSDLGERS